MVVEVEVEVAAVVVVEEEEEVVEEERERDGLRSNSDENLRCIGVEVVVVEVGFDNSCFFFGCYSMKSPFLRNGLGSNFLLI